MLVAGTKFTRDVGENTSFVWR